MHEVHLVRTGKMRHAATTLIRDLEQEFKFFLDLIPLVKLFSRCLFNGHSLAFRGQKEVKMMFLIRLKFEVPYALYLSGSSAVDY